MVAVSRPSRSQFSPVAVTLSMKRITGSEDLVLVNEQEQVLLNINIQDNGRQNHATWRYKLPDGGLVATKEGRSFSFRDLGQMEFGKAMTRRHFWQNRNSFVRVHRGLSDANRRSTASWL